MKPHKIILFLGIIFTGSYSLKVQANCKDSELRQKVAQAAKAEGVNENELLSIIAHESRCHYFTIAWNLPGKASTAKSKFLNSLEEAQVLAEELIATKQYRVDVGIGQINNEAHIKPKGWSLEEILNPETALYRVAKVLKESGWANYHSRNPTLSKKWQGKALMALNQVLGDSKESFKPSLNREENKKVKDRGSLMVFNAFSDSPAPPQQEIHSIQKRGEAPLLIFLN